MTRHNESHNIDVPSPARIYTTYEVHTAAQLRFLSAMTVRPKSLYEDVHASTGHPESSFDGGLVVTESPNHGT